jgi:hypothetical protein
LDVAETSERGESQIDTFIERRHDQRVRDEGERAEHELWHESERLYFERESRRQRWELVRFCEQQAERVEENARVIAARRRAEAQKLIDELIAEERNGGRNGHHH